MSPRVKKLIGSVGVLAFLVLYIGAAAWIGDRLPASQLIRFAYFGVAGIAWGLPLIPFLAWMNRDRRGTDLK
jgi:hypothetical protein